MRRSFVLLPFILVLAACGDPPPPTLPPGTPASAVDFAGDAFTGRNFVSELLFTPDGALWTGVADGIVRWNLTDQTYSFYGAADGLGLEGPAGLAVDARGRVVAATSTGIHRWDGAAWTALPAVPDAPRLDDVVAQGRDTLWLGTAAALFRFNGRKWARILDGAARRLYLHDDVLWLELNGTLTRLDTRNSALEVVPGPEGKSGNLLGVDAAGAPWMALAYDAVYRLPETGWEQVYASAALVCSSAFGPDGTPYLGTCGGFHAYGAGVRVLRDDSWLPTGEPPDVNILGLAVAADGTLAIGTPLGVSVGTDGAWQTLQLGPLRAVTALAAAPDGALFVAYGSGGSANWQRATAGVSRLGPDGWSHWPDLGDVHRLTIAPDGTVWAAGVCSLDYFRDGAWHEVTAGCDEIYGTITGLAFTPNGELWIGNGFRLTRYAGGLFYPEEMPVSDMAVDGAGAVWIEAWTGRQGEYLLYRYENGVRVEERPLPEGGAGRLLSDSTGQVWLLPWEGATLQPLGPRAVDPLPLPFRDVRATAAGPDGTLWFATADSLVRFQDNQWRFVDLPPDWTPPTALTVAPDGTLWRGDAHGVARQSEK